MIALVILIWVFFFARGYVFVAVGHIRNNINYRPFLSSLFVSLVVLRAVWLSADVTRLFPMDEALAVSTPLWAALLYSVPSSLVLGDFVAR